MNNNSSNLSGTRAKKYKNVSINTDYKNTCYYCSNESKEVSQNIPYGFCNRICKMCYKLANFELQKQTVKVGYEVFDYHKFLVYCINDAEIKLEKSFVLQITAIFGEMNFQNSTKYSSYYELFELKINELLGGPTNE